MRDDLTIVGKSVPLRFGKSKVTGIEKFVSDRSMAGALYMKILRSPHPHARIKMIDTSKAEAMHGVGAVITYKDSPPGDVVCGIFNWKGKTLEDRVRFIGDEVAAVAAISEKLAEEVLQAIKVDYEILPAVFDLEEAAKPGAPDVKGTGSNITETPPEPGQFRSHHGWGDVAKGFAEAEATIETEVTTQSIYGGFFPPACIADWDGDKLHLMVSHQCPFELRITISNALGIPENKIRLITPMMPGTFGMMNSGHRIWAMAGLISQKAGKPVIYKMTLEEYGVYKRRENDLLRVKIGGKKDGTITALDYVHFQDNGGYGYKSTSYGTEHDILPRANVKFHAIAVNTNRFSSGCIRAVGDVPQSIALNQAVDMLAEKLGIDPITIWKKNHTRTGDPRRTMGFPGKTLSSEAFDELLDKGARAIGWDKKWKGWGKPYEVSGVRKKGVGVALGLHCSGVPFLPVAATVNVNHDGTAQIGIGFTDLGTGSKTTFAQIAAEVLGFKFDDVFVVKDVDTDAVPYAPMTSASGTLHVGGSSIKVAAMDAKRQILEIAAGAPWKPEPLKTVTKPDELDIKDSLIYIKTDPSKKVPIQAVLAPPFAPIVIGRAARQDLPFPGPVAYVTMVTFADVEVDTETGKVNVLKIIAGQDSGRIVNPEICENQVYGGTAMSVGYALSEEIAFDPSIGKAMNPILSDYWWPTSLDMPPTDIIFSEVIDPVGPFGAKGIGETPAICPHAAIASAVYNAAGVRIKQLPLTPDVVLRALGRIR